MKICPHCALANEERFPACLWCNTPLMDVRSTPSADPTNPEHRRRARNRQRQWATRRQLAFAVGMYVLAVVGLAVWPGWVIVPKVAGLYAITGLAVSLAMLGELVATFLAAFVQGALSLMLLLNFGPLQPFAFFMLLGHVLLPMVLGVWLDLIHDANR